MPGRASSSWMVAVLRFSAMRAMKAMRAMRARGVRRRDFVTAETERRRRRLDLRVFVHESLTDHAKRGFAVAKYAFELFVFDNV